MQLSAKKIALLHYAAAPVVGGVESVMNEQASLLADAGHAVRVIAARGAQQRPDILFHQLPLADSRHPEILALKSQLDQGKVPDSFARTTELLTEQLCEALADVEIVIAHNVCCLLKNLPLTAALYEICKQKAIRLISWQHDIAWSADRYASECHDGFPWDLIRKPWEGVNQKFIAVSKKRQQEVAQVFGLSLEEVSVISSGVDQKTFLNIDNQTASLLSTACINPLSPTILLPVRVTRRKNIELALRIVAELGQKIPNLSLIVTGPPGAHNPSNSDYFVELVALRKELGLEPNSSKDSSAAYFLCEHTEEFIPDIVIADLYRIADALLITSLDEGLGIPVIEAGFGRLPAFCGDIPTFREIAGEHLHFFSLNDSPTKIAQMISTSLLDDQSFLLRQRVRERYSWERIFKNQIQPLLENTK